MSGILFKLIKDFQKNIDFMIKEIDRMKISNNNNFSQAYNEYFKSLFKINFEFNEKLIVKRFHRKLILSQIHNINLNSKKIEKIFINSKMIFIEKIDEVKNILEENKRSTIILENMIFSFKKFVYEPDYHKYQKITYDDLKFADIILSLKNDKVINSSLVFKLIYLNTNSHIGHASIFYEKKAKKYYFIDTIDMNLNIRFKKTNKINYSKDVVGIVLRKKGDLTQKEQEDIKYYLDNKSIGKKLGFIKGAFLSIMFKSYEKIPFYTNLKNPFTHKKSVFCSENIARAYERAKIYLSDKDDPGTVTPIDLFNSKELEVVGYLDY